MNRYLCLLFFILSFKILLSQEYPYIKNFGSKPYVFNPAASGLSQWKQFTGVYRMFWTGFEGNPQTIFSILDSKIDKLHGSGGILFMFDDYFSEQCWELKGSYAFRLKFGESILQIGAAANLIRKWNNPELYNNDYYKESIFDFDGGIFFKNSRFYAGFSVVNILSNEFDEINIQLPRKMFFVSGYKHPTNENWEVEPNLMLRFDNELFTDLNLVFYYKKLTWFMTGYSTSKDLSLGLGGDLERVSIAYIYTLSTRQTAWNYDSHEMIAVLRF